MAAPAVTLTALRDLAAATPLSEAEIARAVEQGVVTTYRRLVEDDSRVRARVNLYTGTFVVYRLDDEGIEELVEIDIADFPRQAAAAARTAVAERLANVEQRRILGEGATQRGVLRDAIVERRLGTIWYVDAGGVPGILPPEEQIPGERLAIRDHIKVVIVEGRRKGPDAVVVVSRSHPQLVQRLMEQEVPELQAGQVVIRAIARDPGRRTKVAVDAPDGDVDAQGACIGRNGVRQRAVTSELGEEQVQIVAWSADPGTFVMNSLIPAAARGVELDLESRTAHISVATDQLSLAIGRGGENARLAARLTGWRIDIRGDEPQEPDQESDEESADTGSGDAAPAEV
jgi:N utilization substance protein A